VQNQLAAQIGQVKSEVGHMRQEMRQEMSQLRKEMREIMACISQLKNASETRTAAKK
jgi:prefoldin subunit 5